MSPETWPSSIALSPSRLAISACDIEGEGSLQTRLGETLRQARDRLSVTLDVSSAAFE